MHHKGVRILLNKVTDHS